MMEAISTSELILLGVLTLIGIVMITFLKDARFPFVGTLLLGLIMVIIYDSSASHQAKAFVLQRFNEGQAIECGLWRGESALINSHNGWKHIPNLGFVKGDQIHNDLGVCNVIAQEAPEPSVVPYGFALLFELMLAFGLRRSIQKELHDEEDNHEPERE
jgi:hypothetical protein